MKKKAESFLQYSSGTVDMLVDQDSSPCWGNWAMCRQGPETPGDGSKASEEMAVPLVSEALTHHGLALPLRSQEASEAQLDFNSYPKSPWQLSGAFPPSDHYRQIFWEHLYNATYLLEWQTTMPHKAILFNFNFYLKIDSPPSYWKTLNNVWNNLASGIYFFRYKSYKI